MSTFLILNALLLATAGLFVVPTLWQNAPHAVLAQTPPQRLMAAALLVALGLLTGGLYAVVGEPHALAAQPPVPMAPAPQPGLDETAGPTPAQIEGMVNRLAQRLQDQPNDPQGWRRLAKSYETLGRFELAVQAYQRLLAVQPPDADLLTDYAVTLGMSRDQTLVGEPEVIINQALKLDPQHIQSLALSGSVAFERRDYQQAVARWTALLALIPKDAAMRASIEKNLERAEGLRRGQRAGK